MTENAMTHFYNWKQIKVKNPMAFLLRPLKIRLENNFLNYSYLTLQSSSYLYSILKYTLYTSSDY